MSPPQDVIGVADRWSTGQGPGRVAAGPAPSGSPRLNIWPRGPLRTIEARQGEALLGRVVVDAVVGKFEQIDYAVALKNIHFEKGSQVEHDGAVLIGDAFCQGAAKMMAGQFFTSLGAEAKTAVGEPPPQHGFFRTALRWFSGILKNVFSRR